MLEHCFEFRNAFCFLFCFLLENIWLLFSKWNGVDVVIVKNERWLCNDWTFSFQLDSIELLFESHIDEIDCACTLYKRSKLCTIFEEDFSYHLLSNTLQTKINLAVLRQNIWRHFINFDDNKIKSNDLGFQSLSRVISNHHQWCRYDICNNLFNFIKRRLTKKEKKKTEPDW